MPAKPPSSAGPVEQRFEKYLAELAEAAGHADRILPLKFYCMGLLLPLERKSVEPMAARLAPANVRQMHQSLHHVVADAPWNDEDLLQAVRNHVLPGMTEKTPLRGWIVDDTGFPKKGKHSVGVIRQYCGQLGKQENCRVAVSLSVATEQASMPIAYRLYLPQEWAEDPERRQRAGVPEEVVFQTKPKIALEQIRQAVACGVPRAPVLADAAYGNDHQFRSGVEELSLPYVLGVQSSMTVWPPGTAPLSAKRWKGIGRPPSLLRRNEKHQPPTVKVLAESLPSDSFRNVTWREGTRGRMHSRFTALRVRPAHRDYWRKEPHSELWLLVEWPRGESEPTKYWLSNLPLGTGLKELVSLAKLRWRIERDYEELKQELGLGHYEGRGWRGFHHHATLCIAAYGFLIAERSRFSPSLRAAELNFQLPKMPPDWEPRGSADQARTA
jgi:SRSO17 transposase